MAMADSEASRKDPHHWNPLENYLFLHEKHLEEHPLVDDDYSLDVEIIESPDSALNTIVVQGTIPCTNGIILEVHKTGEVEKSPPYRVRMFLYSHNARFPGGHNVLRYDNQHRGQEHIYHRHQFDPETGREISCTYMTREEFPVMHQILDELMDMFPPSLK